MINKAQTTVQNLQVLLGEGEQQGIVYIQNMGAGYAKKNLLGAGDTLAIILGVVALIVVIGLGFYCYKKKSAAKQISANQDLINAHNPGANSFTE